MNKIIVICGFSASGKDSIVSHLSAKNNLSTVISHTSRPMRPNEYQGNPYHFISRKQFEKMIEENQFIECRTYNTLVNNIPDVWYYGVHKDSIDLSKRSYIVVLDILGLKEFKQHFGENIISFFIEVDEPTRKSRCIDRADFDPTEWERRYQDDKTQFTSKVIYKEVDFIVENYDFEKCVNEIVELIGDY